MSHWISFETRVPGKWVLTGEHAVLTGVTAVALPHPEVGLTLKFAPATGYSKGLTVTPSTAGDVVLDLLHSVRDSLQEQDRSFEIPSGRLWIESSIPIGAGLGSSAALCVAITRWLSEPAMIARELWAEFATQLEHRFHGRSSGMDVSVIVSGEPVTFVRGRGASPLGLRRLPRFTFHDTGLRARTSDCVLQVEAYREERPIEAMGVDEQMGSASRSAIEGLLLFDQGDVGNGLRKIAQAMALAHECFVSWQLAPPVVLRLREELLGQGALAVKLTGAGAGGILVALWER